MNNFKKVLKNEKEHKNLLLYNILLNRGQVSRADITEITKINPVSISNYTSSFIKKGLVVEKEVGLSSGGRPPIILELNNKSSFAIGIHVMRKRIIGSLNDVSNNTVDKFVIDIDNKSVESAVTGLVLQFTSKAKDFIKGIGLCIDGVSINENEVEEIIKKYIDIPVFQCTPSLSAAYKECLERDFNCGERILYSYREAGSCVLGNNFNFYTCEEEIEYSKYLKDWDIDESSREPNVYENAKKKDPKAIETLEYDGLNLGVRLAYLINVLKPERLIIGGSMIRAGDYFIEAAKRSMDKLALEDLFKDIEISYGLYNEDDAVATGAAALVIREYFIGV